MFIAATWNEYRELTARAVCVQELVLAGVVVRSVEGTAAPESAYMENPVSSEDVSCQDQVMVVSVIDAALGFSGAVGGLPAVAAAEKSTIAPVKKGKKLLREVLVEALAGVPYIDIRPYLPLRP
jgi:hypothetical protein